MGQVGCPGQFGYAGLHVDAENEGGPGQDRLEHETIAKQMSINRWPGPDEISNAVVFLLSS